MLIEGHYKERGLDIIYRRMYATLWLSMLKPQYWLKFEYFYLFPSISTVVEDDGFRTISVDFLFFSADFTMSFDKD